MNFIMQAMKYDFGYPGESISSVTSQPTNFNFSPITLRRVKKNQTKPHIRVLISHMSSCIRDTRGAFSKRKIIIFSSFSLSM